MRRVIPGHLEVPELAIQRGQRASDADRSLFIGYLARRHEDGSLDTGVFTARMEAAADCVTLDELAVLVSDLPPLAARRPHLPERLARLFRVTMVRRWAHALLAIGAAAWMILIPAAIFTATGFEVTYRDSSGPWTQTEHPGLALAFMWMFILTGLASLVFSLVWWFTWETDGD